MTYQTEFPNFANVTIDPPNGFADHSWGNDLCPFFLNESNGIGIWVEHPNKAEREFEESSQFTVVRLTPNDEFGWQHGDDVVLFETDDWSVLLNSLANF